MVAVVAYRDREIKSDRYVRANHAPLMGVARKPGSCPVQPPHPGPLPGGEGADRGEVRAELIQYLQRKFIADYVRDILAKADVKIIEQQAGAAR